jgi:hypothetical protein
LRANQRLRTLEDGFDRCVAAWQRTSGV